MYHLSNIFCLILILRKFIYHFSLNKTVLVHQAGYHLQHQSKVYRINTTLKKPHLKTNTNLFSRFEHTRSQTGLRMCVDRKERTGASIISETVFFPLKLILSLWFTNTAPLDTTLFKAQKPNCNNVNRWTERRYCLRKRRAPCDTGEERRAAVESGTLFNPRIHQVNTSITSHGSHSF